MVSRVCCVRRNQQLTRRIPWTFSSSFLSDQTSQSLGTSTVESCREHKSYMTWPLNYLISVGEKWSWSESRVVGGAVRSKFFFLSIGFIRQRMRPPPQWKHTHETQLLLYRESKSNLNSTSTYIHLRGWIEFDSAALTVRDMCAFLMPHKAKPANTCSIGI